MKNSLLFSLLALTAWNVAGRAQPAVARDTKLEAPLVSSAQAQKLALPDDIQIHLRDVTLRAALQELEKQSGLPFDLSGLSGEKLDAKISIDIDTPSVTRALDAIADEANLKLILERAQRYDEWHVRENRGGAPTRYTADSVDGPFAARLLKLDVSLFKQLDLDNPKPERTQKDNLNVTLELAADPGWPIGGLPTLRATRAEDDKGRSLLAPPRAPTDALYNAPYDPGFADIWSQKTATLQLLPPAADARAIAHLEGEALYLVATKRALWELPDLLKDKEPTYTFNIGETPVKTKISNATLEAERGSFRIEFALPEGVSWQSFSGNLYSVFGVVSWMSIEDARGTRLVVLGGGGSSGGESFYSNVNFSAPTKVSSATGQTQVPKLQLPLKLTFSPPTDWVQAQAKFKFDDVPLP